MVADEKRTRLRWLALLVSLLIGFAAGWLSVRFPETSDAVFRHTALEGVLVVLVLLFTLRLWVRVRRIGFAEVDIESSEDYVPVSVDERELLLAKEPYYEKSENGVVAFSRLLIGGAAAALLVAFNFAGNLAQSRIFVHGVPERVVFDVTGFCVLMVVVCITAAMAYISCTAGAELRLLLVSAARAKDEALYKNIRKRFIRQYKAASGALGSALLVFLASLVLAVCALYVVLSSIGR